MHRTKGERIFDVFNYIILGLLGLVTFYPFYYILIYSLSNANQVAGGIYLFPKGFTFDNYIVLIKQNNIGHAALISFLRTIIGTSLTLLGCSMFAYSLTKDILPFRKLMYRVTVTSMYISSGIIPWYITMKSLHLRNNFLVYIIPMIVIPFYLILIKTYFEQIPPAMEESAMIDGASYSTIFFKIILPLSKPIIATVAIFQAVTQWNSWVDNLYLCTKGSLQTLQLLLLTFLSSQSASSTAINANVLSQIKVTPTSIRMTITVMVVLPIFLVYPFMQKYFIKGIMIGAVKG